MWRRCGALILFAVGGCLGAEQLQARTVKLVGSDTELSAAQRLAEAYRAHHPDVVVSVAGGGSGAGIAALLDGRCDVANSSRRIRDEERRLAQDRGLELSSIVLGIDALAVIVHEDNPVHSLTLDQLGRVFRGEWTTWGQMGGTKGNVTLYGRQSNSGTYSFFRKVVLEDDYALSMRNLNGNAQILEAVRNDRGGIGYVGVGYVSNQEGRVLDGIRVLSIETEAGRVVHPTDAESVESGAYPISRPLLQYHRVPLAPQVADFLRFELSTEGQSIVAHEGFYRVGIKSLARDEAGIQRAVEGP